MITKKFGKASIKRFGKASIKFENPITIKESATIGGKKEGDGPLKDYFDRIEPDPFFNTDTWEKAESRMVEDTINLLLKKTDLKHSEIDYIVAGDLLNQSSGSSFGIKDFDIPVFGIYGACSNIGEGFSIAAAFIDGGFADKIIVNASSHFCSAEKQFRSPLELGNQRTPTSSWTVTGDGAFLLTKTDTPPYITKVTTGKIIDMGIKDQSHMGAAMAPAACDTILNHFKDFKIDASYYDLILTGDLGKYGGDILIKLLKDEGYNIERNYKDCGKEIFYNDQDVHAGGSGCGCAAATFGSYFFKNLSDKKINKILFVPTGALLSATSVLQNLSIPSIAHAVAIENQQTCSET